MGNYYISPKKYYFSDELTHYGILGQKWGLRRFQNPDGSLTSEGLRRYRVNNVASNVGRALTNSDLGQRVAVNLNKGYRADKKAIKAKSKELRKSHTSKEYRKQLKSDTKKTLGEARTSAANAIYGWQGNKTNEKIQTQSVGKGLLKSMLAGPYGAVTYDKAVGKGNSKVLAAGKGIIMGALDQGLSGIPSIANYSYNKTKYNRSQKSKQNSGSGKSRSERKSQAAREERYRTDPQYRKDTHDAKQIEKDLKSGKRTYDDLTEEELRKLDERNW